MPATFGHWPAAKKLGEYEDRLLDVCHERGLAVEINTRFLYRDQPPDRVKKYLEANARLIRKARARGVGIAVGSGAHSPKDRATPSISSSDCSTTQRSTNSSFRWGAGSHASRCARRRSISRRSSTRTGRRQRPGAASAATAAPSSGCPKRPKGLGLFEGVAKAGRRSAPPSPLEPRRSLAPRRRPARAGAPTHRAPLRRRRRRAPPSRPRRRRKGRPAAGKTCRRKKTAAPPAPAAHANKAGRKAPFRSPLQNPVQKKSPSRPRKRPAFRQENRQLRSTRRKHPRVRQLPKRRRTRRRQRRNPQPRVP